MSSFVAITSEILLFVVCRTRWWSIWIWFDVNFGFVRDGRHQRALSDGLLMDLGRCLENAQCGGVGQG